MQKIRQEIILPSPNMDISFFYSEDNGKYVTPHWHNTLELVYVIEGTITVTLPDNQKVIANADEFFIVNARTIHSVLSTKNKAMVFHIPQKMYEKFVPSFEMLTFSANMNPSDPKQQTELELTKKLFREICAIYSVKSNGWLLLFNSRLYELLYFLYRHFSRLHVEKELKVSKNHFSCVHQIIKYIDNNYQQNIAIGDISETLHYNKDYVSRLFKKYMNMTIIDYVYMVRLNHISKDLLETDLTLNEIFEKHGCTNYKVSLRKFKEHWGCTPREFRQKNQS